MLEAYRADDERYAASKCWWQGFIDRVNASVGGHAQLTRLFQTPRGSEIELDAPPPAAEPVDTHLLFTLIDGVTIKLRMADAAVEYQLCYDRPDNICAPPNTVLSCGRFLHTQPYASCA